MNKDSIYKIIGYQGEYSDSVKRALKRILKVNHPDHGGDVETFKLINEVKKELENQKVPYKAVDKKNSIKVKSKDIDVDYCKKMIQKLQKELLVVDEKIASIDLEIKKANDCYKNLYQSSQNTRKYLLNNSQHVGELRRIKRVSIIFLLLISIMFFLAVLMNNIVVFSVFGLMCLCFLAIFGKYFVIMKNIAKNNENNLNKYIRVTSNLAMFNEKKEELLANKWSQEQKKKKIKNDLRFYNNLIK